MLAMLSISTAMARDSVSGADGGWPGSVIAENSTSPDGRYGVLLPTRELAGDDEDSIRNVLVNLQSHARLGVIQGAHYFPGFNHRGLRVEWAEDSSLCVVTYEARYGFDTITVIEPRGATCAQGDIGRHIQKSLDAVIARQSRGSSGGCGSVFFRFAPRGKVVVRATDQTNPKAFEDQPTWCALFQGTFDFTAKKWTRSDARKIDLEEKEALDTAFIGTLAENTTFASDADRLKRYDDMLNEVYRAVRLLLPGGRFAAVKKAQIAWLKQLDAIKSDAGKCKFMEARIEALREFVWDR